MQELIWKDRKRTIFGLPLSFTVYELTEKKLLISTGFFHTIQREIDLYEMNDFELSRSLIQKIFGVGDIIIHSSDTDTPTFVIESVKEPYKIKELLDQERERERIRKAKDGTFKEIKT